MILAYLNGDLIKVELVNVNHFNTVVRDHDGNVYCVYPTDESFRKLFDGKNAVYDAVNWIEQQNGITIFSEGR